MTTEPVAATTGAGASDLIGVLRNRAPRIAMGIAAAQMAWPVAKNLRTKRNEQRTYTVKVTAKDAIYDDLHEWVLAQLPPDQQRALVAWTTKTGAGGELVAASPPSSAPRPRPQAPQVRLRYDGSRAQTITISGHKIGVYVTDGKGTRDDYYVQPAEIQFTAWSVAAKNAVIDALNNVAATTFKTVRKPMFRVLNQWCDWQTLEHLPNRTLDSVILPPGQLERIIADVDTFLSSEDEYLRRCMPWHRGHLYEGKAGTGKTSVARAVADHFNLDIWYLPLADVRRDATLLNVINHVTQRSILLLEDVDVFHAAKERDESDSDSTLTLSGLLNALDGIATPHGLFTILTTNDKAAIDPALIRPGRIDLVEHFDDATPEQILRILSRWYGVAVKSKAALAPVSPARVIEACKSNPTPAAAIANLKGKNR
ncbi:AAA family ATPase [Mycolicibacterium sphagni]|uniref:AAA family ATPase n=1 Tax=Mycolicibacterium sphagni TaxID=1786 RepID=UPI0021F376B3|nr:AAA family ATPase [Mycolicibacterium sphagni]MCV7175107.1 AAA family ATPase [Mycolicibacterium sphagni]